MPEQTTHQRIAEMSDEQINKLINDHCIKLTDYFASALKDHPDHAKLTTMICLRMAAIAAVEEGAHTLRLAALFCRELDEAELAKAREDVEALADMIRLATMPVSKMAQA